MKCEVTGCRSVGWCQLKVAWDFLISSAPSVRMRSSLSLSLPIFTLAMCFLITSIFFSTVNHFVIFKIRTKKSRVLPSPRRAFAQKQVCFLYGFAYLHTSGLVLLSLLPSLSFLQKRIMCIRFLVCSVIYFPYFLEIRNLSSSFILLLKKR